MWWPRAGALGAGLRASEGEGRERCRREVCRRNCRNCQTAADLHSGAGPPEWASPSPAVPAEWRTCSVVTTMRRLPRLLIAPVYAATAVSTSCDADVLQVLRVQPFGVLGTALRGGALVEAAARPERAGVGVVDPAGLHHIQPPGGPRGAGGASGAIYLWLGIAAGRLPRRGRRRRARDGRREVRRLRRRAPRRAHGRPRPPARAAARGDAIAARRAYANILRELAASDVRALRLLPVSGGIFAGPFKPALPEITCERCARASRAPGRHTPLYVPLRELHLCIFADEEVALFGAAVEAALLKDPPSRRVLATARWHQLALMPSVSSGAPATRPPSSAPRRDVRTRRACARAARRAGTSPGLGAGARALERTRADDAASWVCGARRAAAAAGAAAAGAPAASAASPPGATARRRRRDLARARAARAHLRIVGEREQDGADGARLRAGERERAVAAAAVAAAAAVGRGRRAPGRAAREVLAAQRASARGRRASASAGRTRRESGGARALQLHDRARAVERVEADRAVRAVGRAAAVGHAVERGADRAPVARRRAAPRARPAAAVARGAPRSPTRSRTDPRRQSPGRSGGPCREESARTCAREAVNKNTRWIWGSEFEGVLVKKLEHDFRQWRG